MFYKAVFKPFFDKIFALILLVVTLPISILVYIILGIVVNANPIFYQSRPGLNGTIFTIFKFKSMTNQKDLDGNLLPDKQRLFGFGKLIRKLSIDEIPQLYNVLIGDMSFVGPRPLLSEYLPLYNNYQNRRHKVKPGITGWAQVNGRNSVDWITKFNYDIWYVDNQSFLLDLKILFLTFIKLIIRDGVSAPDSSTMPKFRGNKKTLINNEKFDS